MLDFPAPEGPQITSGFAAFCMALANEADLVALRVNRILQPFEKIVGELGMTDTKRIGTSLNRAFDIHHCELVRKIILMVKLDLIVVAYFLLYVNSP